MPSENAHKGHRKRLREKFLKSGLAGFHDYEVVELLLSLGTPRRDCKLPAKEAIKRFKTLRGVLEADTGDLEQIKGIGAHSAFGIKLVQEVAREYLKARILTSLSTSRRRRSSNTSTTPCAALRKRLLKSSISITRTRLSIRLISHRARSTPAP